MEHVILVDSRDRQRGTMEKMEAHQRGELHRAFSVILFNNQGEILLQKRSSAKYHSPGLWSNTCCSHPRPEEKLPDAVNRRLKEEMGLDTDTSHLYHFIYKYKFNNQLTEHELDHVYIGETNASPSPNPNEAEDWKWSPWHQIFEDISENSDNYSFWFKQIVDYFYTNPYRIPKAFRPKF